MSKKILSVVLALVLVMSTFVTVAFAANYEADEDKAKYTQTWSLTNVQPSGDGSTYTVDVNLKTNYATGVIQFAIVEEDTNNVIQLTGATLGSGVPAAYNAKIQPRISKGIVYIVPQAAEVGDVEAVAIDGVVATLTFSYTGSGKATVAIKNDPKTEENAAGTLIAARMGTGKIGDDDMIGGQTVTNTEALITPVELGKEDAQPADLVLKAAYADSGIIIDKNKTFDGAYDGAVYGMVLSGNGTTQLKPAFYTNTFCDTNGNEIVPKMSVFGRGYGTGTVLEVVEDGKTTKRYIVIIFGDIDGNSLINIADSTRIFAEYRSNGTLELPQIMACNIEIAGRNDAQKTDNLYKTASTDYTKFKSLLNDRKDIQAEMGAGHLAYPNANYA